MLFTVFFPSVFPPISQSFMYSYYSKLWPQYMFQLSAAKARYGEGEYRILLAIVTMSAELILLLNAETTRKHAASSFSVLAVCLSRLYVSCITLRRDRNTSFFIVSTVCWSVANGTPTALVYSWRLTVPGKTTSTIAHHTFSCVPCWTVGAPPPARRARACVVRPLFFFFNVS